MKCPTFDICQELNHFLRLWFFYLNFTKMWGRKIRPTLHQFNPIWKVILKYCIYNLLNDFLDLVWHFMFYFQGRVIFIPRFAIDDRKIQRCLTQSLFSILQKFYRPSISRTCMITFKKWIDSHSLDSWSF